MLEWRSFVAERKEQELETIIKEEKLKPEETRKFIEASMQAGEIRTVGTDIDKLMPRYLALAVVTEQQRNRTSLSG